MSLVIVDAGIDARIVDAGRPRTRHLGVPVGGAADRAAWQLANALLGNNLETPAIEIAVKGPILRAEIDLACALVGAPFELGVGSRRFAANSSFNLERGDELLVSGTPRGMRAYLAVAGGFDAPTILGSRSGLTSLRTGDRVACAEGNTSARRLSSDCPLLALPYVWTLRAVPGPQSFDDRFFDRPHTVSRASDRMGLRLEGEPLLSPGEMTSEAVCPGSVQITREGLPIVLGVDGQTIGGYPKIAVVIDADLDALGQMRPGDRVRFQKVSFAEAAQAWSDREQILREWRQRIEISLAGP